MENILNITNGDSAVNIMKEAGLPGEFLPWRDVLHDGPVPAGLSLEKLSEIRAQFIIDRGWAEPEAVRKDFKERDKQLQSYAQYTKVILWFEHDLYDQLQILQILDWFSETILYANQDAYRAVPGNKTTPQLTIICTEQYLGMTTPQQMLSLLQYEQALTRDHLKLARRAWQAFRSPTPQAWAGLIQDDTSLLPFLHGAIIRQLEEYPNPTNGLSRTATQALRIVSEGEQRPGRVFGLNQDAEQRIYMGDSSFWIILHQLLDSQPPLLVLPEGKKLTLPTSPDQQLSLTPAGKEVLAGQRNWLDITTTDHWIGGVHLHAGNIWCWDTERAALSRHV